MESAVGQLTSGRPVAFCSSQLNRNRCLQHGCQWCLKAHQSGLCTQARGGLVFSRSQGLCCVVHQPKATVLMVRDRLLGSYKTPGDMLPLMSWDMIPSKQQCAEATGFMGQSPGLCDSLTCLVQRELGAQDNATPGKSIGSSRPLLDISSRSEYGKSQP